MTKQKVYRAVDLYCGGGGTSKGLAYALSDLGGVPGENLLLTAINHWNTAILTHTQNHPWAEHRCERVEAVDRTTIFPGSRIDLLVASPECVHFSRARGDKPVEDQKRAGAWYVLDWIADRKPRALLIENVPDIMRWGRIREGKQIKHTEGEIFRAYVRAIRAMGYTVAYDCLNAADYGAVTTRTRFYLMARLGNHRIAWPKQTHSKGGAVPGTKPWRAAREILDLTLPSRSIFRFGRPTTADTTRRNKKGEIVCGTSGCHREPGHANYCGPAQNTLDRIAKGLRDTHPGLEPLAVAVEDCSGPIPLVDLIGVDGLRAIQAWTLGQHGGATLRPDSDPLATIAAGGALELIEAIILGTGGPEYQGRPRSSDAPLPTVMTENRLAVAQPFILPPNGLMGDPRFSNRARRIDEEPLQTITAGRGGGQLVQPVALASFLASYYGNGDATTLDQPVGTVTTHDRFALISAQLENFLVDVYLRMLQPKELAAAMGFPADYAFSGSNKEIVRQIGNAVEVNVARALCRSLLRDAPRSILNPTSGDGEGATA